MRLKIGGDKRGRNEEDKHDLPNEIVEEKDYGIKVQNEVRTAIEKMEDQNLKKNLADEKVIEKVKVGFDIIYATDWQFYTSYDTGEIMEKKVISGSTLFRVKVVLDKSVDTLMKVLYDEFENQLKWNKSYKDCQVIAGVDKNTDVTYRKVEIPLSSTRDYVLFRHKSKLGNVGIIFQLSIKRYCDPMLNQKKKPVRATIGPSVSIMKPMDNDPDRTHLMVMIDSDLKGPLQRFTPDSLIPKVQAKYMSDLRGYLETLL